jgi:hypothetical protein
MLAALINEPTPSLRARCPEFPEDLVGIVQHCLAKDPDGRFPNVTSLDQTLGECSLAGTWTQTDAAAWWNSITDNDPVRS